MSSTFADRIVIHFTQLEYYIGYNTVVSEPVMIFSDIRMSVVNALGTLLLTDSLHHIDHYKEKVACVGTNQTIWWSIYSIFNKQCYICTYRVL